MLSQAKSAVHKQAAKFFQQHWRLLKGNCEPQFCLWKGRQITRTKAYRQSVWQKWAANIIKPTQSRIYRKKYVNGSVNSEGHVQKLKTRHNAYLGLYGIYLFVSSKAQSISWDSPFSLLFTVADVVPYCSTYGGLGTRTILWETGREPTSPPASGSISISSISQVKKIRLKPDTCSFTSDTNSTWDYGSGSGSGKLGLELRR